MTEEKAAPLTLKSLEDLLKQLNDPQVQQEQYEQSTFERFHMQSGFDEVKNNQGYSAERVMDRALQKFNEWKSNK